MAKEFKKWIDEFVEHGANPKNVVKWPEEAGGGSGTKVVTELPQVGEEHTIYELQEKKKIPSLIPRATQQMVIDGVFSEVELFVFVFDTSEDMTNVFTSVVPEGEHPFYINYIIKEDKMIMSGYVDVDWQFAEVTKVSDCKFDLASVFGGESSVYLVMLKEYLGKSSEEGEDVKYAGKLLNDELYTFEPNTFGVLLGAPTGGIMVLNHHYEAEGMPIEVPKEYTFEYIPYEKIIKNQLMEVTEGMNVLWAFKSNGTSEGIASSYWIYTNKNWFNADEIKPIKLQDKNVEATGDMPIQKITADEGYDGLGTVTVTRAIDATYTISILTETLPQKMCPGGAAQVGSNVYLFGGSTNGASLNTIYKFNVNTETITTLSVILPEKLHSIAVAQSYNSVYLFGGRGYSPDSLVNTIYKFDTKTETIAALSVTLPQRLYSIGLGQVGSNVYLFGGVNNRYGDYIDTIYKFNIETETIVALSTTLPQRLEDVKVAQLGNNIYLFGGYSGGSLVNTIYKFNIDTEVITTLSVTLPQRLRIGGVAQIGSNIYLFGGMSSDGNLINTIYKFNTDTETVSTLSVTLPQTLRSMRVGQVGSNVYLFGGSSSNGGLQNSIYKIKIDF